jgi:hypothetical protein
VNRKTAINKTPYDVAFNYLRGDYQNYGYGFEVDPKKHLLSIDINNAKQLIIKTKNSISSSKIKDEHQLNSFAYILLDSLLHIRAHQKIKDYKHTEGHSFFSGRRLHSREFFESKEELRRNVIDFIEENKISLKDYISKYIPIIDKDTEMDKYKGYYAITTEELSNLLHMTRRRLIAERMIYDKKKAGEYVEEEKKITYRKDVDIKETNRRSGFTPYGPVF